MRKLLLAFVATVAIAGGLLPRVSVAQSTSPAFSQTGLLTSLSSPPIIAVPLNPPATCTLIVSGTFVGTVTFDESADGGQTYPAVLGTATAAGTQVFSCNGYYTFRARFTAYTSGAAQVNITTASVGSGSGGGGGGTAQISPLPLPVAPTGGPYQIIAASPIPNVAVNGTTTPVTITNACGTPTTPSACVANNSAAILDLGQNGSSDYSYQINTISGATLAFYTSNDGVNFFAANLTISGSGPSALGFATSTQVAGKFAGIGGSSRYAAIVATVAPTAAITVIPYLGSHSSAVSVHAAVPLTIASLPPVTVANTPAAYVPVQVLNSPAPYVDVAVNPSTTAAPLTLDANSYLNVHVQAGAGTTTFPYAATNNQTATGSSFLGAACVYSSTPPTLSNGQVEPCLLDVAGNHLVNLATPLLAGTAIIGKVGIDQTTPGTTNAVQLSTTAGLGYATGTPLFSRITNGTTNAGLDTNGELYVQIESGGTVAGIGIAGDAKSGGSTGLFTNSLSYAYNGTNFDRIRKDTNAAGPIWVTPGGATNLSILVGVAGPTVVKASTGRIVQFLVTTAGTTSETFYDNASACSGTIIGITPATTSVGSVYAWNYTAVNGITACGAASTSPAGTIAYF